MRKLVGALCVTAAALLATGAYFDKKEEIRGFVKSSAPYAWADDVVYRFKNRQTYREVHEEFEAKLITGKEHAVKIGAEWCTPCREMDNYLKRSGYAIPIEAIDLGEYDEPRANAIAYEVSRRDINNRLNIPMIFVVSPEGSIKFCGSGYIDEGKTVECKKGKEMKIGH